MIIRQYENENGDKMEISPKSRKIATSIVDVLFDTKKIYKLKRNSNHKETTIYSGFKMSECASGIEELKHNKKRTRNRKYIG